MTTKKIVIKKNTYYDSVYLMGIFEKIEGREGLGHYHVLMATDENRELLKSSGFSIEGATANDLVIAVEAESSPIIEKVLKDIEDYLTNREKDKKGKKQYDSLDKAIRDNPSLNLAVISVPGKYAAAEAENALNAGLHVFIFSDNVSLKDELRIKKLAKEKNLLLMGPDAGVGSVNGIALATGSKLKRGPIGIVAASGSGAQEVSAIIDRYGPGTSQLIGTGGKDLSGDIGGLTMLSSIDILEEDPQTKVIVLVAKLSDRDVIRKVLIRADSIKKPTVAVFLGAEPSIYDAFPNIIATYTLKEAASAAVEASLGKKIDIGFSDKQLEEVAREEASRYSPSQKYIMGLYMGGTFTEEALIILRKNTDTTLYSNISSSFSLPFKANKGNILIDMGSEEFTLGRPHPVIDPSPRTQKFTAEAKRDDIAAIALDFILSYGVHTDPAGAITPEIKASIKEAEENGRHLTVIASVCGTEADPQKRSSQEEKLKKAGAIVVESSTDSAILLSKIVKHIRKT